LKAISFGITLAIPHADELDGRFVARDGRSGLTRQTLPADAFGALVSLVFNRGTDLDGDRRIEMRQIRSAIDTGNPGPLLLQRIAAELRKMKRLWHNNPDSDGDLVDRREAEAKLVEDSKYSTTPA